jgi:hypothetical protein
MLMLLFLNIGVLIWTLDQRKYSFVGYGDGVKGYILWDPTTHEIIISRYVVFDESSLIKLGIV